MLAFAHAYADGCGEGISISEAARRAGVCRTAHYKWGMRYEGYEKWLKRTIAEDISILVFSRIARAAIDPSVSVDAHACGLILETSGWLPSEHSEVSDGSEQSERVCRGEGSEQSEVSECSEVSEQVAAALQQAKELRAQAIMIQSGVQC